MKTYRVIELFSGVGAQRMALKRLEKRRPDLHFEFVAQCEIDKHAINSYNAIHGETPNLGDITKVEKLPLCDILTWSFPCFTGDTLIRTMDGWKEIMDIQPGDIVETNDGWHKVTDQRMTGIKEIVKVKTQLGCDIRCTPNHLFYARKMYHKWNNDRRQYDRLFEQPTWVAAKDLTKEHYVGYPIQTEDVPISDIPEYTGYVQTYSDGRVYKHDELKKYMTDPKFWYTIGRYVADGWTKVSGIVIAIGKGKESHIDKMIDLTKTVVQERTCKKVHISKMELKYFCQQFGEGAINKHIPQKYLTGLPRNLAKAMLDGYLDGDGCYTNNGISCLSISKQLMLDIQRLVGYVYGRPANMHESKQHSNTIEGRIVNISPIAYQLKFTADKRKQDKAFVEDGWAWGKVNEVVELPTAEEVYDITVEDAHSFIANGICVHNCTDLSQAGNKMGMDKDSGTRSALAWEVIRLLNDSEHKPEWLLMENVPAITYKTNIDTFKVLIGELEKIGYNNKYQILNAVDFDVAQNRKRCFMISHYKRGVPEFPKGQGLHHCLRDYLDKDVDPKYYLSKERLQGLIVSTQRERERGNGFGFELSEKDGRAKAITTREGNRKYNTFIEDEPDPNGTENVSQ